MTDEPRDIQLSPNERATQTGHPLRPHRRDGAESLPPQGDSTPGPGARGQQVESQPRGIYSPPNAAVSACIRQPHMENRVDPVAAAVEYSAILRLRRKKMVIFKPASTPTAQCPTPTFSHFTPVFSRFTTHFTPHFPVFPTPSRAFPSHSNNLRQSPPLFSRNVSRCVSSVPCKPLLRVFSDQRKKTRSNPLRGNSRAIKLPATRLLISLPWCRFGVCRFGVSTKTGKRAKLRLIACA